MEGHEPRVQQVVHLVLRFGHMVSVQKAAALRRVRVHVHVQQERAARRVGRRERLGGKNLHIRKHVFMRRMRSPPPTHTCT